MNTNLNTAESRRHAIKHFINKFTAIPDERWCEFHLANSLGQRCALGHTLGVELAWVGGSDETLNLVNIFSRALTITGPRNSPGWNTVADINNGHNLTYRQPTPKARILAALHDKLSECL